MGIAAESHNFLKPEAGIGLPGSSTVAKPSAIDPIVPCCSSFVPSVSPTPAAYMQQHHSSPLQIGNTLPPASTHTQMFAYGTYNFMPTPLYPSQELYAQPQSLLQPIYYADPAEMQWQHCSPRSPHQ